ncbi:hypothetical protein AX16_003796 [Volvariella volvacea WC 439]|nr:hypothetical protein AX16_003796 [Volvariella volvacea WC 439]
MSSAPAPKPPPAKSKRERERERREKQVHHSDRLKVVVRRLPPNLPEEVFWQSVQPWVTDETVTWKVYYPGKFKKRLNKENIPSRAYIAFKSDEMLAQFSREYDGHVFRDKAGNESQAVVEYAPYQKIPNERKKTDARNATIENDEDYISFLETLNAPVNREPVSIETLMASTRPPTPPKTTPLLEALKAEKSVQKDKEAILRNHAHYKDQVTIVNRKDESKRKPGPPQKQVEAANASKKPGKKEKGPVQIAVPPAKAQQQHAGPQAKNAPVPAGPSAGAQPNSKPPKPPKPPRAPRQNHQANAPSAAQGSSNTAPAPAQSAQSALASSVAVTNEAETPGGNAPPSAPSRRGRPVLGLGGRHFEAAMSGVGAAAGERKSRRERQKEKEAQAAASANGATQAQSDGPTAPAASTNDKPVREPPTPKRDRKRKDDRVPTLLKRGEGEPPVAILQKEPARIDDVPVGHSDGPVVSPTTTAPPETFVNHPPPGEKDPSSFIVTEERPRPLFCVRL